MKNEERPKNNIEIDCNRDSAALKLLFLFFFSSFFFSLDLWTLGTSGPLSFSPFMLIIANEG